MDSFCFFHVYLGKVKYFCKEKDTQYDKLYIYHLICRLKTDNRTRILQHWHTVKFQVCSERNHATLISHFQKGKPSNLGYAVVVN